MPHASPPAPSGAACSPRARCGRQGAAPGGRRVRLVTTRRSLGKHVLSNLVQDRAAKTGAVRVGTLGEAKGCKGGQPGRSPNRCTCRRSRPGTRGRPGPAPPARSRHIRRAPRRPALRRPSGVAPRQKALERCEGMTGGPGLQASRRTLCDGSSRLGSWISRAARSLCWRRQGWRSWSAASPSGP